MAFSPYSIGSKSKGSKFDAGVSSNSSAGSPKSIDSIQRRYLYSNYSLNEYYNGLTSNSSQNVRQENVFDLDGYSVDDYGRVLSHNAIGDVYEAEENIELFASEWMIPREAAIKDGPLASACIWPDIPRVVHLQRYDIFQSDRFMLQQVTCDKAESHRIRASGQWHPMQTFFCLDQATPLTKEISIMTSTLPKRDKFIPKDKVNSRDLSRWVMKGAIHGYIGIDRIPGTSWYYIDFQDTPDRYMISTTTEPFLGFRRLYSFAAYEASQYYILQKQIHHECLESENGMGMTYMLERGTTVFSRKHWRLVGSFYGFNHPVPGSNCYSVYIRQDPFPRMQIVIGDIIDEGWQLAYKFYSFDVTLPGTVSYQLQHTVKSIHSSAQCITRHRLSVGDMLPPWEFRMTMYVFPATIDDCSMTTTIEEEAS